MITIGKVQSRNTQEWYNITYNQANKEYKCSCKGFIFNQACKHINGLKDKTYPYAKVDLTDLGKKVLNAKPEPMINYLVQENSGELICYEPKSQLVHRIHGPSIMKQDAAQNEYWLMGKKVTVMEWKQQIENYGYSHCGDCGSVYWKDNVHDCPMKKPTIPTSLFPRYPRY